MPTIEVLVNGRRHAVQCGQGEEARVRQLASYVDRRIAELARGQSQVGDARLMLMASLVVADELSDAFDEIKVDTGGNDLKVMTGGVGINFVTKRGTNKFHGSVRSLNACRDGRRPWSGALST